MKRILSPLLGIVLALTVALVPAAAKTPPGPSRLALEPVVVDAHLGYQKQKTCSPSAKPGTKALLSLLIKTWGGSSSGISRSCNVGGVSEHKEGRALDWHMDVRKSKQRKAVADALKWMTANNGEVAYRLGIMYIIWDQKIWSIYYQELGWRKMADRGSRTANHKDHVHISLSWDGAMKQTSWWTGKPVTEPRNQSCGSSCLPSVSRLAKAWKPSGVTVPPFLPAPWTVPGIGGSPQVGRTLTAVAGTWVPDGASVSYQWLADGVPIAGATAEKFTVPAALVGRAIKVRVTALTGEATRITKTSDGTNDVVKANFRSAPTPVVVGSRSTGSTLSVQPGSWNPAPTSWSYQWYRNSKKIKGATKATYRLGASDLGKRIWVKVTGKLAGYNSKTVSSAKTGKIIKGKLPLAPVPQVSGTMVLGQTLKVTRGSWGPSPVKLSTQWYRDGVAIPKATGTSYRLTAADVGKVVQVRVKGTRKSYLSTYRWSAAGDPVSATWPTSDPNRPDTTPSPSAAPTAIPTPTPPPTPPPTPTPPPQGNPGPGGNHPPRRGQRQGISSGA